MIEDETVLSEPKKNNLKNLLTSKPVCTQSKPQCCTQSLMANFAQWTMKNEPSINASIKNLAGAREIPNANVSSLSNDKTIRKSVAFARTKDFIPLVSSNVPRQSFSSYNRQDSKRFVSQHLRSFTIIPSLQDHDEITPQKNIINTAALKDSLVSLSLRRNTISTVVCQTLKQNEENIQHQRDFARLVIPIFTYGYTVCCTIIIVF